MLALNEFMGNNQYNFIDEGVRDISQRPIKFISTDIANNINVC